MAAQSIASPGARVDGSVGEHVRAERPLIGSLTVTACSVTLPVFRAENEYVTTSPATTPVAGDGVLVKLMDGAKCVVTVVLPSKLTGLPLGSYPEAVAVLSMCPASTSACVTAYFATHFIVSPGAIEVGAGGLQSNAESPGSGSVTSTLSTVTVPVFSTTTRYSIESPTLTSVLGLADLVTRSFATDAVVTVAPADPDTGAMLKVLSTVAMLLIAPAFMSAWVTVYVAVQTKSWPGSIDLPAAGVHVKALRPGNASETARLFRVTVPVFVPVTVYVMTSPTTTPEFGDAVLVTLSAGVWTTATLALAVFVTGAFAGFKAFTVAVFATPPLFTSAWVTV